MAQFCQKYVVKSKELNLTIINENVLENCAIMSKIRSYVKSAQFQPKERNSTAINVKVLDNWVILS